MSWQQNLEISLFLWDTTSDYYKNSIHSLDRHKIIWIFCWYEGMEKMFLLSWRLVLSRSVIQSSPHHINPSQKEAWECQIWIHVEMNHRHTRHSHHKCVPSLWPHNGERYRSREKVHQWWWLGTCDYDNYYHWISAYCLIKLHHRPIFT